MRLFFGLFPPENVLRGLLARQHELALAARPVAPERVHMTLVFLGETPAERLGEVCRAAGGVALPRCALSLDRAGSFRRARVAWLAPSEGGAGLQRFQSELAAALLGAGLDFDQRPWRPHVTLYRDLRKPLGTMPIEPVVWDVREYRLVESRPGPRGPEYRALARWPAACEAGHRDRASENPPGAGGRV